MADGSVDNIPTTTDGSGSGAEVRVNFSSGDATTFILQEGGIDYEVGDKLFVDPADAGGSSGTPMELTVTSVDEDSSSTGPDVTVTADVATIN